MALDQCNTLEEVKEEAAKHGVEMVTFETLWKRTKKNQGNPNDFAFFKEFCSFLLKADGLKEGTEKYIYRFGGRLCEFEEQLKKQSFNQATETIKQFYKVLYSYETGTYDHL